MSPTHEGRERLEALLATRATEGLSETEGAELRALLSEMPDVDEEGYERAAAAVALSHADPADALPPALRAKLAGHARRAQRDLRARTGGASDTPLRRRPLAPWLAAAAAALLAALAWWPRPEPSREEARSALVETAPDLLQVPWEATADPAVGPGLAGDVAWSSAEQQGFMRFRGLRPNDPSQSQYQLWIFDRSQDERHPIDGGVFDVASADEETVVPIRAKLKVAEPYLFAVTVEKPGGVVVSSRERLALLAKVGS